MLLKNNWPLHLLGLSILAVSQPVLDLLGRNPEFFVAHHTGRTGILILLAAVLLVVPIVLIAMVAAARLAGRRGRDAVLWTAVALLVAIFMLPLLKRLGLHTAGLTFSAAAIAGIAAAILYARVPVVRTFATMLSLAALAVPVVFLLRGGIRTLVFAGELRGALADLDPSRPSVVLFVFDETPLVSLLDSRREIDPVLYPNLAALANDKDGAWFRNATATADYTRWALPAILDGRFPRADSIPAPADHPDTLFTLLGRTHRIESFEAVTALCPESLCPQTGGPLDARLASMADDLRIVLLEMFLPDDLTAGMPDLTGDWANFAASSADADEEDEQESATDWRTRWHALQGQDKTSMTRDFIDGIGADDPRPTFYFMHTLMTHHPYTVLPHGAASSTRVPIPGQRKIGTWDHDEWEVAQNYQRHLMAIEYMDALIGRTVKRLKDAGVYDNTMVVVTADHGISFGPGEYLRTLRRSNAPEIVHVPLIVKWPQGTAAGREAPRGTIDRNVEAIDIAPTIAAAVGVSPTWPMDGVPLVDASHPERPGKAIYFNNARRTMTFGRDGPGYADALARKLRLFGERGNRYRVPTPPKYASLMNTAVDAQQIQGDARIAIAKARMYDKPDFHAQKVPFDITGIVLEPRADEPTYVAVAVNGTIRAVTRTWTRQLNRFDATPDPAVWQSEGNTLQAFVVTGPEDAPVLHGSAGPLAGPPDLNLMSTTAWPFGVTLRGFYRPDGTGEKAFRWTRGRGIVNAPVDPDRPPTAVRVDLARGGRRLRITAEGCTLFDGDVPAGDWQTTLSLSKCPPPGPELSITFESGVTRRGSRRLGVGVRSVVLVR